jgi:hypothetical protein
MDKPKMRGRKKRGVNWLGTLKQKGVKRRDKNKAVMSFDKKVAEGFTNPGRLHCALWRLILWVRSLELVSYHFSGACIFQVVPRFLENLCIPDLANCLKR